MQKKVIYLTSGKIGIATFTYKELELLEEQNVPFVLAFTQLNKGHFMPKSHWDRVVLNIKRLSTAILSVFVKKPIAFLRLLNEAKQDKRLLYFLCAVGFYRLLQKEHYSSIHVQMADHKLAIAYYLSKLLAIPYSCKLHAHELYMPEKYNDLETELKFLNACSTIVTISQFNRQNLIERFHINPDKISVMYLYPSNSANLANAKATKLLIVANWVKKKGYLELFQALSRLKRKDIVLWVAGGPISAGHDQDLDLPKLTKEYGIQENVLLLGSLSSAVLNILYSSCDIFCLPSLTDYYPDGNPSEREGLPISLMEAMSYGKPVITTKHAGIPELVSEYLIEEGDVASLVKTIEYLVDHPDTWQASGNRNKEIVNSRFSYQNVTDLVKILQR